MQKVAVYCRVSTDKEDQINSLESQKRYFREYIEQNLDWELFEIYADEGITGTSTKKRLSFHKMMNDAMNHKFDVVITKEISRFARNSLDSIYYTRRLKELGIGVFFMNDNINTLDADAELRLTILSSIAQEESRRTSERVKWGQKRRMEQGIVFGRDMLGYDVRNGKLYVNEEGAKLVKLIFHKFTNEGKGTHIIARELREEGIPTGSRIKEWSNITILRILKNEKYMGDLIQKKTYTPNYLTHEKKYNLGKEEYVIINNHHEPIISRELFERTGQEIERRSSRKEEKRKYSNRYCLSGKILCGICGNSYVARTKNHQDESVSRSWRCYEAVKHGSRHQQPDGFEIGCNAPTIKEEEIKSLLKQVVKEIPIQKDILINELIRVLKDALAFNKPLNRAEELQVRAGRLTNRKTKLIELYLSENINLSEFSYLNQQYEKEIEEINNSLREQGIVNQNVIEELPPSLDNNNSIIEEITNILESILSGEIWDDIFYHNLIEKIVVIDKNKIDLYFKSSEISLKSPFY